MEQTLLSYLNSQLNCRVLKDWDTVYIIFSPFVLAVLGHFPQEIHSEMEICMQVGWISPLGHASEGKRKARLSRGRNYNHDKVAADIQPIPQGALELG